MGIASVEKQGATTTAVSHWPLWQRAGFRFLACYLVLYNTPGVLGGGMHDLTTWAGRRFFHVTVDLTPNGSGDTTAEWVRLLCTLALALALCLVWSIVDRRRQNYDVLNGWLRVYARYILAFALISYGAQKVIPVQFSPPSLMRLQEPFGDASPMGLLWTFMGASPAYTIFAGSLEMIGGLLLVCRRTTLIGSLMAAGVMSNVVALNLCYDVPVKLYSTDLLLLAVYIASADTGRLVDFFLRGRASTPPTSTPLVRSRKIAIAVQIVKTVVVIWMVTLSLREAAHYKTTFATRTSLDGQWEVTEWDVEGHAKPRLVGDADQWRRLVVQGDVAAVQDNADDWSYFQAKVKGSTLFLSTDSPYAYYLSPAKDLYLSGMDADGKRVQIKLRKKGDGYQLTTRGFHWINEEPYSR